MPGVAGPSHSDATSLTDDPVQQAEDARKLIAKRNLALDSLGLDEARTNKVEQELHALGWPTDLASNQERTRPSCANMDSWPENDTRALLCLKRHTRVTWKHLWKDFFWTRNSVSIVESHFHREINSKPLG